MTNCHGGWVGLERWFLTSVVNSWQFLAGRNKQKQDKRKMGECTVLCQLTTLQNGWRSCVANASDQTTRPAWKKKKMEWKKNLIEQKAQPTVALSHRNKSSAKRQLWKWAGLAALRQQFAENWTMLSAQHDCTLRESRRNQRGGEEQVDFYYNLFSKRKTYTGNNTGEQSRLTARTVFTNTL